ncbi:probable G-protein coupled receptor 176 isoform X1 [Anguilla rostrata]|uniref:probable G-protein coupled receptor 176 isoform X1 n=1 Tax=Anguilla rostrata TaxID=7938 RepID=UPI0030CD438B
MEDDSYGSRSSNIGSSNVNFTPANLILNFHNTSMAQWDMTEQEMVHLQTRLSQEQTYRNFTTTVQVLIFIGSLLGNSVVLWFTCRTTILKPVTNCLVRNLACSSVCACLVCLPSDMVLSASSPCCWRLLPPLLCKMVKFLHKLFCSVTILTFAAIAMDRYYSVLYPLERKISDAKFRGLVIYMWVHGAVVSLPVFAVSNVVDVYAVSACPDSQSSSLGHLVYTVTYNVTTVVLPLAVVFFFLTLIRHALSASQKKKAVVAALRTPRSGTSIPYVSQREAELHATLLCSVLAFMACGAPYAALVVYRCSPGAPRDVPVSLLLTAIWLPKVSLLSSPALFLALNRPVRRCLLGALARLHRRYSRRNAVGAEGGAGAGAGAGGAEPGARSGSQLLEMFHVGQQQIFRPSEEDEEAAATLARPGGRGEEPQQAVEVALVPVASPLYGCTTSAAQVAPVSGPEAEGDRYGGQVGYGPFELPPQWLSETRSSKKRLLPPLGTTPEELIQTKQPRARPEHRISRNNKVSTFPPTES